MNTLFALAMYETRTLLNALDIVTAGGQGGKELCNNWCHPLTKWQTWAWRNFCNRASPPVGCNGHANGRPAGAKYGSRSRVPRNPPPAPCDPGSLPEYQCRNRAPDWWMWNEESVITVAAGDDDADDDISSIANPRPCVCRFSRGFKESSLWNGMNMRVTHK